MCGIFGIISCDGAPVSPDAFKTMGISLLHRGPDHTGFYTADGVALGANRLSVVDLATGNQPIFNEDKTLVIVYNGEIYNHRDLRADLIRRGHSFYTESDSETVIHAFEEFGEDCPNHFNGMFAFAIWDIKRKKLFLARDRLGIKPLYMTKTSGAFAFASEAKGLLNIFGPPEPDWTAINRYFSFGYIPSPQSPFAGIEKLSPAHSGIWQKGEWQVSRYWTPASDGCNDSPEAACEKLRQLLERSVEQELMSDVPLGVFLSGGLDSSAVSLFAGRSSPGQLNSFALRFEEETHDESSDAALVAAHLGLNHTEVLCSRELLRQSLFDVAAILDEPFADSTVLPLLILSRHARKSVKVALTGWGGDEIFAGYPTYSAHRLASMYRRVPRFLTSCISPVIDRLPVSDDYMSFEFKAKRFIKGMDLAPEIQHAVWMEYFNDASKAGLFRPAICDQIAEKTYAQLEKFVGDLKSRDSINRIMQLDSRYYLEGNGLFEADRIAMAASLEVRVPLLNIELINYVNSLPSSLKMRHGVLKGLLRKTLADDLPSRIIHKPKKGFGPPSALWVRGIFADVFDKLFSRERIESQGIFNHAVIDRMLEEHRLRRADHGRNLWALMSFQLWYNRFIADERND